MQRLRDLAAAVVAGIISNYLWGALVVLVPTIAATALAFYAVNPQIFLSFVLIAQVALNTILVIVVIRGQRIPVIPSQSVTLTRDADTGKQYLIDIHGRAREIPDDDTASYLSNTLDFDADVPTKPSAEIARIKGEKLIGVNRWYLDRPRTPQQKAAEDLWHQAVRSLEKTNVRFDDTGNQQQVIVEVTNRGEKPMYVKRVKFQHDKLHTEDLAASYKREDIMTIIDFDPSTANIASGSRFQLKLRLSHKFKRAEIELNKGHWGILRFELNFGGESIINDVSINI